MDPTPSDQPYPFPEHSRADSGGASEQVPDIAPPSDSDLVRRMADGDEQALGLLYDRMVSMVYSIVGAMLADSDAEEVVEETFWQAWQQAGRYRESRGGVSTWVGMIGRSRALDRIRARRRIREESWEELPEFRPRQSGTSFAASPLQRTEEADLRERVAAALEQLPDEQRETLVLAYFHGMSQNEISAHMGSPLGTVKTRVRLAMQKLRESLHGLKEELE